jgi:hypothetical protein
MSTDHKDLIERLRGCKTLEGFGCACEPSFTCGTCKARQTLEKALGKLPEEAADAIAALVAERDALKRSIHGGESCLGKLVGEPPRYTPDCVLLRAERDAAVADAAWWHALYRRAINEANGLTNYVEDRPELHSAEKRIAAIEADARQRTEQEQKG